MSDKIVVYSNDLNQISLGSLKEQEQNLFFSLLVKLKDKGHEPVLFTSAEISKMLAMHYTQKQIVGFIDDLKNHFFKLDFRTEKRLSNGFIEEDNINLFKYMRIRYNENRTAIEELEIEVNERFEYMLNQLKANFTAFELANFLVLNSKYSKTLFRLLKQYRTQGWWQVEIEEFRRLMGAPKYRFADFERKVLTPSIKELTWDNGQPDMLTDYRGAERPCFKNLSVEKIKGKGRGRGGAVVALKFTWEPELVEQKQITQSQEVQQPQEVQDTAPDFSEFEKQPQTATENEFLNMSAGEFASYYRTAMKDTKTDKTALIYALGARQDKEEIIKICNELTHAEKRAKFNNALNASLKTKPKK
jgi:plasmid replication initiation protein